MNSLLTYLISGLALFHTSYEAEYLEVPRYYRIQNKDGFLMTVGGGTQNDVKIITEAELIEENPIQRFYVRFANDRFEISPENQNTWSTLCLGLNSRGGYLTQQTRRGASLRNQRFHIRSVGNDTWVIQHDLTGNCLASEGKFSQINATICDASAENQKWTFNVAKFRYSKN